MTEYEERNRSRQAVLMRCKWASGLPIKFPVPLSLSGGPWWKRVFRALRINAWSSSEGDVFATREHAAFADHMQTEAYKQYWARRAAASRIVNAKRVVDAAEYHDAVLINDRVYDDIDECIADVQDDEGHLPAWVHGTTSSEFAFDMQDALGNYLSDNHHEDAELSHMDELKAFFAAWSAKQDVRTYWEDSKTIVVLDRAAFDLELAEAKAFLALPAPMKCPYAV